MKKLLFILMFLAFIQAPSAYAYSVNQAKEDMKLGRYATAIENLSQLVNQEQSNYEAWFLYGVANVHEQKYTQATEAFQHVISLRPDLAEPHNNLAAVYSDLGDFKAAVKELETALGKRPNYVTAEENLADLYIKLALQHYRNTLRHSPNPIIEQRYARLMQVRNPIPKDDITSSKPQAHIEATPTVVTAQPQQVKSPKLQPIKTEAIAPAKLSAPVADQSITGILDALEAWRLSWSSQNLNAYFSAYASDYQPSKRFANIDAWKAYKTRVIKNKTFIRIEFEQVEVNISTDHKHATVMLLQRFHSNSYNGKDFKKISFKYTPTGWKITAEESVK